MIGSRLKLPYKWSTFQKCYNIFLHTPYGSQYSSLISTATENVMKMTSSEDITTLTNRCVQLGQSSLYAVTYLDCASGRVHDSILPNLCSSFFAVLPDDKPLSCTSRATTSQREKFAQRVDKAQEYHQSSQYNMAWQNAYHTALAEIMSTRQRDYRNITRQRSSIQVPRITSQAHKKVSIYVREFIVLKVNLSSI